MDDDDADDASGPTRAWLELARRSGAGVAGSLLGYALAGPPGAVAGGAAPPALEAAFRWLEDQWRARSLSGGQRVIADAAETAGLTPTALAARLSESPKRLQLAGLTLTAAAMTADEDKLRALARALGAGATDDARVDPEILAVNALADMEAPHIKVLSSMAASAYAGGQWRTVNDQVRYRAWIKSTIARELPELGYSLEPVLGTLLRHGLLIELHEDLGKALDRRDQERARGFGNHWRPPEPKLQVTAFGQHCLELLREIASEEEDASQGQEQ